MIGADQAALDAYRFAHECCQVCWSRVGDFRGWSVHHLVRRSRRRCDQPWNLLFVDAVCHAALENEREVGCGCGAARPAISFAEALWVKRESGLWRPESLGELYRPGNPHALPEPEPLGAFYLRSRERNRIGYALPVFEPKPPLP